MDRCFLPSGHSREPVCWEPGMGQGMPLPYPAHLCSLRMSGHLCGLSVLTLSFQELGLGAACATVVCCGPVNLGCTCRCCQPKCSTSSAAPTSSGWALGPQTLSSLIHSDLQNTWCDVLSPCLCYALTGTSPCIASERK